MIKVSESRKEKVHRLYTISGKPLFNKGSKHTAESVTHRLPSETCDSITSAFNVRRAERASLDVGEKCEWRFERMTEIMYVSI